MFLNTYRKAFIAKAAIECMKKIVQYDLEHGVMNDETQGEDLTNAIEWEAQRATIMAEKLAQELDDRWIDGGQTVFFAPQDQPDNVGQCVANAIERFTEKYFDE